MSIKEKYQVQRIKSEETYDWCLNKHYAKRTPTVIKYCFGLFNENSLLSGIIVFSLPPIPDIQKHFGNDYIVFELSRLVVNDGLERNVTSYFVGNSIKSIPEACILISYADCNVGHVGYIYQATNWIYTGKGGDTHNYFIKGKSFHSRHDRRHKNELTRNKIEPKNRYIYFHGNKREKREMKKLLKWGNLPYPKGDNERYDASYEPKIQLRIL